MKFIATIQARMGSSRLPGKVLMKAAGKHFLQYQVDRVRNARLVDEVVIATTDQPHDDEIELFCDENKIKVFRGAEDDVLDRIATCLSSYVGWGHVELVGDSPFVDPAMIDEFIGYFLKHQQTIDYVSNGIEITYPNGAEINVYLTATLIECNERVLFNDPMREHVDIHIYKSGYYKCINLEAPKYLCYPEYFIELDTEEDYYVLSAIANYFDKNKICNFHLSDIVRFLKMNPKIANSNKLVHRKYIEVKKQDYEM